MLTRLASIITLLTILAAGAALAGSATISGASNLMNPALSVNGLVVGQASSDNDDPAVNGVRLQEAEMHFTSVVDPFWTADVILSVAPDETNEGYLINVEEASVQSTSLPWGLGVKLGQFFVPFGKHSPLHTHQFPFVESPVALQHTLGDGFTEVGANLSVPMPLPWFSDVHLYGVDGTTAAWEAGDRDLVLGARWTNLVDVGDESTLELGGSYVRGPGGGELAGSGHYAVAGVDLTYKWVSMSSSHGPAFTLQGEVVVPHDDAVSGSPLGWYAMAQYRLHHSWWLGVTHGRMDADNGVTELWESKLNLTHVMSEFSAVRAEVGRFEDRVGDGDEWRAALQVNFTIGSHPAHNY